MRMFLRSEGSPQPRPDTFWGGATVNPDQSNVVLEVNDSVALVRLDRPGKLNAFTFRMIAEIRDAVERAASDENAVGIVITGTGRAFSAGLDTSDLARSASGTAPQESPPAGELPALFSYLLRV